MASQTLDSGTSIHTNDWAQTFGGVSAVSTPHPDKQVLLVYARSGTGKSHFIQSIDNCFVINADASSTCNKRMQSVLWPYVREDGMMVESRAGQRPLPNGSPDPSVGVPIALTWAMIEQKIEALCEAANNNRPRPSIVAFDTVDACYRLIQEQMVVDFNKSRGPNQPDKDSFYEIGTGGQWPKSYEMFMNAVRKLRFHGYGVVLSAQLGDKSVGSSLGKGEDQKVYKTNVPLLQDNLVLQTQQIAETVMLIRVEEKTEMVQYERKLANGQPLLVDGKPVMGSQPLTRKVRSLSFDVSIMQDRVKQRLPLPTNIIVGEEPWRDFVAAYNKAAAQIMESVKNGVSAGT